MSSGTSPTSRHLHHLRGLHHEGWRPLESDLAHPITLDTGHGLDRARFGVDDDRGRVAPARHETGLDRRGGRADGRLAAGDVVAVGVHEEQAEVGAGGDGLGHHRDQHAPMPTRLHTESGPHVIQVLGEVTPLGGDGVAEKPTDAGGHQAHPDTRRVEVDRGEEPIGAHGRAQATPRR
jgi:hypothetical protein